MGIVKAVYMDNTADNIALITEIGAIPFEAEGFQIDQQLIDDFNNGTHKLTIPWSTLTAEELQDFSEDISDQFWL